MHVGFPLAESDFRTHSDRPLSPLLEFRSVAAFSPRLWDLSPDYGAAGEGRVENTEWSLGLVAQIGLHGDSNIIQGKA